MAGVVVGRGVRGGSGDWWVVIVDVVVGLFGEWLSSMMPLAVVFRGKAITRPLSVLPMLNLGSGFRDVLAFPELRGTD